MPIHTDQLARWKQLVATRPSADVKAHWSALRVAAESLLALAEQQTQEIARLQAELEVTTRDLDRLLAERRRSRDTGTRPYRRRRAHAMPR